MENINKFSICCLSSFIQYYITLHITLYTVSQLSKIQYQKGAQGHLLFSSIRANAHLSSITIGTDNTKQAFGNFLGRVFQAIIQTYPR